jgi:predicted RNA binding protein YcfA (HicA-like mRNA interferase family)
LPCLATRLTLLRAREVNRAIERRGGVNTRTRGSHRWYQAVTDDGIKVATAVPQHPGDIKTGTLRKIERELEPAFGKGWLLR